MLLSKALHIREPSYSVSYGSIGVVNADFLVFKIQSMFEEGGLFSYVENNYFILNVVLLYGADISAPFDICIV